MDSDSRKATTGPIDDSSAALLERSKLVCERGLELQRKLKLSCGRTHELLGTCQQLAKSISESCGSIQQGSGIVLSRIDVGTQDMSGNTTEPLQKKNALRRDDPGLDPLRDGALGNAKFLRNGGLAAGSFDRFLDKVFSHNHEFITEIDVASNAKSDIDRWHDPYVIPAEVKSAFWDRLLEAAKANGVTETQEAIAAEFGIKQSAVAKWKAGGRPKTTRLEKIAARWRYNINYLLNGELPKRPIGVGEPDETAELIATWKALNGDNKKAALAILKQIRKGQPAPTREKV